MANLHEIKAHIANVESTKKVTRAMYLISASKSQKAKAQLQNAFPYFQSIESTLREILGCSDEVNTPFIRAEEDEKAPNAPQRDVYLVMGGDKGMAGGYNNNLLSVVEEFARKDVDELLVAGYLGRQQLRKLGYRLGKDCDWAVMNPNMYRARDMANRVIEMYLSGEYRNFYVIYTEMVTSLKLVPQKMQMLPLDLDNLCAEPPQRSGEEEYLPSARAVFEHLVPHYLKGILYTALVEAFASEQHARMFAMDGATKSANETIDKLSITYNHARQARITQELTEIISGIPQE